MFNTLASYLLGNTTNATDDINRENNNYVNPADNDDSAKLTTKFTTKICEDDDDWLLVVKHKDGKSLIILFITNTRTNFYSFHFFPNK